jgi:PAS domain S-box-containing protein
MVGRGWILNFARSRSIRSGAASIGTASTANPAPQPSKKPAVGWLGLGTAVIALIALTAVLVARLERQSYFTLRHTSMIVTSALGILADLEESEAEEHGYLLTGQALYLGGFDTSRRVLEAELDQLRELAKNNPKEQQRVEKLRYLVQRELNDLQTMIDTRATAGFEAARALARTSGMRQRIDALRQYISGMATAEQNGFARYSRERQLRLRASLAAFGGSTLLASFFLLIGRIALARSASRSQRAEEQLQASESRFRTLCEQAPLGIYETNAKGQCIYTNRKWSAMSGLSASESLGHGWKKALHPGDRERVFEKWEADARQGKMWEYRLINPLGETRRIRAVGGPIYSAQGDLTGYVGALEDVTEYKRSRQAVQDAILALQEKEALNRAVLNALPANIAVLKADGKIQAINDAWRRFGQQNSDPLACLGDVGSDYLELCKRAAAAGSGDAQKALAGIQDVLAGRRVFFELRCPCASPSEKRWFQIIVTPLAGAFSGGAVVAHVDITERKRAKDAVHETLQQLQLITDNMPAGVTQCSHDIRYLWASRSYATWQGLTPEEIVGRPILDVIGPEAYEIILPHIEKVLSGEREEYEAHVNYRRAGARWIHAVNVPTRNQDGKVNGWIAVLEDITDRHEAEERLRESEERFRNMADTAPVMIWMSGPDKDCTFFNRVWLEFTGRALDQELGYGWAEGIHPDDLDRCMATYSAAFDARRRFRMEYRLRRADGEYRWILDDGVPRFTPAGIFAGYIGSCIDITERRRAEEEREKFVSLADRSLEFIGMCDLDFTPFYVNSAGMRLVGLDNLEAASRRKVLDYFFPEDQPFVVNEFFPRVLREGHAEAEIRFRHFKTGEAIWMLWNVFGIFDARGKHVGWATVSIDISERKQAERALQESRQELRALAGRLINAQEEERKRISRELHDDLNQKLALLAIDTGSLLLTPPSSADKMAEQLRNLQTRVVQLSRDVRQISHRLHPSILDDLGLTAALSELCEEFSAREGIEVRFENESVPKTLPAAVASSLYRVAQEALHNVLKHAHTSRVQLTVRGSSEGIELSICDAGVGFESESSQPRHGLGIVSMKERVRLVQGEFSIHSQPGWGTKVRVFAPLSKEES